MSNNHQEQVTTARVTGVMYLLLAVTGVLGFLVFHPQVFIADDPEQTLNNLSRKESLARTCLLYTSDAADD